MAKEKNGVSMIRLLITVAIVIAGTVSAFTVVQIKASSNSKKIVENKESVSTGFKYMAEHQNKEMSVLKVDGCDPARQGQTDIAVIKNQLNTMSKQQQIRHDETKESLGKILERL